MTGMRVEICPGDHGIFGDCTLKPGHEGEHAPLGSQAHMDAMADAFARVGSQCAQRNEEEIVRRLIKSVDEILPPPIEQRIANSIADHPALAVLFAWAAGCATTIAVWKFAL